MSRRWIRAWIASSALALVASALTTSPLAGQYFGRNKVQYQTFDFRVLKTPHFDVYFYDDEEAASRDAARMAERWYARLSRILNHEFDERQPIVFYGTHPAFQQTTTLSGSVGEGTGGVTEALKQRVIMPLTGSYQETDHVLGHELVHAFQYDISGLGRFRGSLTAGAQAFGGAPLWFTEGMAEYLSVGPVDPLTAMWLRDAVLTGDVPTIEELTYGNYFPYRWGQAFWAYVGGRWGDATIGQILTLLGQGIPYQQAFERVLRIELDDLSEDWHVAIRRSYLPLLAERPQAREVARPLITEDREGGRLNIGPVVSPDGRFVAFLSERELDVDLWLADARTGEVIRRLRPGTAFDPHFQSLRYINSAGTWSPDSRQFAFSAQRGASDVLVILNVENGRVLREEVIPDVGEIASPTWSPDGRTIVFSGVSGGVSDLYAFDVESSQARQLTDDLFANLHPSFSPDGRTIAFVTDEGPGTDLAALRYSPYRLALIDATGGATRLVPGMEGANINPTWTRDGRGIYFVSDRTGIPNIFRVEVETGQLAQLTRLFGGVSGITDTSPAISAARNADRLLFTAYEDNGYNIYALTTPAELAGTPVTATLAADGSPPLPAVLPPAPRPTETAFNRVATILADMTTGLVPPEATRGWEVTGYSPRLGLDYIGQPQVGVAVGGVAGQGGLYGGVSAIFSDLLGYHTLYTAVQAQGQIDEIGFATIYLNQKHRWNYGAAAQRVPQIFLGQQISFDPDAQGSQTGIASLDLQRYRIFDTSLQGVLQYPFSQNQRVEFSGGLRRLSQDVVVDRYSGPAIVSGGQLVSFQAQTRERFKQDEFSRGYNMAQASAALIYDDALMNYTSPFAGQRYHFELSPTAGQLQFIQALGDYRRYLFLRPFTLAVRGMHFGRYGRDEAIFGNQFIGSPYFIRGYRGAYDDCAEQSERSADACGLYSQLLGTRLAIANVELRVPVIRALVIGPVGFPPVEGFGFFDGGVAWNKDSSPVLQRGLQANRAERGVLTSAGVGGRINLLGYAVLEVSYVRPFEQYRGWHWQFALQPGF
ncbi:MAG: peptidase S9 [Gemmatimonadetes bacterium]|nr:peptidase S9 [Gemmatimonadota bacterium]